VALEPLRYNMVAACELPYSEPVSKLSLSSQQELELDPSGTQQLQFE